MEEIVENAPAHFLFLPRLASPPARLERDAGPGLGAQDVVCRIKARHSATWQEKKLDGVTWQHVGHGVYSVTIEPGDLPEGEEIVVLVEGRATNGFAFEPILRTFKVVPPRPRHVPGDLPVTTVCGRLVGLDGKPRVKVPLTFRIHQPPLLSGGVAVTGDVATAESDERGFFQIDLITGACVAVQIQVIAYNRIVVIPPAPAPGIPVRLFSI